MIVLSGSVAAGSDLGLAVRLLPLFGSRTLPTKKSQGSIPRVFFCMKE